MDNKPSNSRPAPLDHEPNGSPAGQRPPPPGIRPGAEPLNPVLPAGLTLPKSLTLPTGAAMPDAPGKQLPRLAIPAIAPVEDVPLENPGPGISRVAEGMDFTGNAELRGPCSISGKIEGNLKNAPGVLVAVVVTETGRIKGDVVANKISVMGKTEGTLDAAGGIVSLHDGSSVSGHVRYSRIQVNGADLNATLERVAEPKPAA